MADEPKQALTPDVLAILRCPLTRSSLRQEGDELVAEVPEGAGLRYPIKDGIPVLLMDEATLPEGIDCLDAFKTQYADAIPE
ncbi:MAG: Trm112 family protein [Phycisphaeraceae bacterium]